MTDQHVHRIVEIEVARFAVKIFALIFAFILVLQVLTASSVVLASVRATNLQS